jgi:hypothetical protein
MSDSVYNTKISVKLFPPPDTTVYAMNTPSSGGIDITNLVSDFVYYESITSPFVYAEMVLADSTGILDGGDDNDTDLGQCGLRKFCGLSIELTDPMSFEKDSSVARSVTAHVFDGANAFFINQIADDVSKGKQRMYRIKLVNKNAFASKAKQIKRAWPPNKDDRNIEFNQVISDVLQQEVQVSKLLEVTADRTEPTAVYSSLNVLPTAIFKDVCRKSVSLNQSGAGGTGVSSGGTSGTSSEDTETINKEIGYTIFETYDAFYFRSLRSFVTRTHNAGAAPDPDEYHTFAVRPVNDKDLSAAESSQTIISYKHNDSEKTTDVLTEIKKKKRGKPQERRYDVITNTYKIIEKTGQEKDPCNLTQIDDSFVQQEVDIFTEYQVSYFKICNPSDLNDLAVNPKKYESSYEGAMEEIRERTSRIRVPGNLTIKAGDRIQISIPKIKAESGEGSEESDKYSGLYSVISVAHRFEQGVRLFTDMEICKFRD